MTEEELNQNFIDVLLPKLWTVDPSIHWPADLVEKWNPDEQFEILLDLYGPDRMKSAMELIPR